MKDTHLESFLDDVYAPLKSLDERTISLYRYTIGPFSDFLGHPATLGDLEELKVARFLASRVRTRAASTAAKDRSNLRALWELAARRKLVDTWPSIPMVKVPERVPEAWLTDEMQKILDSASYETTFYCEIPAAKWWRALLLLAYDTGERCSAMLSLRWRAFRGSHILYEAESRKGKRRDILRDISIETADAMLAIKGDRRPEDPIFPWPFQRTYVWKRLGAILDRAGLPSGRKDKFHRIRKTTASYYEAAGGSAQRLLDHVDPATTRKYLDPRIVKGVSAPDVLPRLNRPKAS